VTTDYRISPLTEPSSPVLVEAPGSRILRGCDHGRSRQAEYADAPDLNSHAKDFKTADLRKYLDLYLRGSGGVDAVGRVKLMKLLWDAIGTEFGGRHELYEINYSGSHEEIRRYALFGAVASGQYERWKEFAETCMAEYDLDGWKAKDLVNTGERAGPA